LLFTTVHDAERAHALEYIEYIIELYIGIGRPVTLMSTTSTIANVCQIAEQFEREIGLAPFDIERVVHSRKEGQDEWIIHIQFGELDPLIESDDHGAIIVVDAITERPRLIEGM
jgi:hypothetical protein